MQRLITAFTLATVMMTAAPAMAEAPKPAAQIDTTMEELLAENGSDLLLSADKLDAEGLDYSIDSLKVIDAWLTEIHTKNAEEAGIGKAGDTLMNDGRGRNSLTLAGLYLGETVRRNSDLGWEWVAFDEFIARNPAYAEHYGTEAGLDAYVLVGNQGAATPINTALKRVLNGNEESLHYIGQFLTTPLEFDKAVEGYEPGPEPKVISTEMDVPELDDLPVLTPATALDDVLVSIASAAKTVEVAPVDAEADTAPVITEEMTTEELNAAMMASIKG